MMIIGYNKGFLYEIISFAYTGAALAFSWFASPVFAKRFPLINLDKISAEAKVINGFLNLNSLINTIAYFVIIFLILKVLYIFISLILKSLNKIPVIGKVNKILGSLCGIINATIITIFISLLFTLPIFANGKEIKEKTVLKYVNSFTNEIMTLIAKTISENNIDGIQGIDVDQYRIEFENWLDTFK